VSLRSHCLSPQQRMSWCDASYSNVSSLKACPTTQTFAAGTLQVKGSPAVMPDFRCTMRHNVRIRCACCKIEKGGTHSRDEQPAKAALHLQVHLRVDTTLTNNKLDVVAYVARHLTLGDRTTSLAQEFQQVPCEVRTVEVERLGSESFTLFK